MDTLGLAPPAHTFSRHSIFSICIFACTECGIRPGSHRSGRCYACTLPAEREQFLERWAETDARLRAIQAAERLSAAPAAPASPPATPASPPAAPGADDLAQIAEAVERICARPEDTRL